MESVTARGQGLVAVGSDEEAGAVWTSPDGVVWSRVSDDNATFAATWISGVTLAGPGLVAVGNDGSDDGHAAVWVMPLDG
jgi:hypothetical protein